MKYLFNTRDQHFLSEMDCFVCKQVNVFGIFFLLGWILIVSVLSYTFLHNVSGCGIFKAFMSFSNICLELVNDIIITGNMELRQTD